MPTTPLGAPYPSAGGAPNDVPGDLKALAEWADANVRFVPPSVAVTVTASAAMFNVGTRVYPFPGGGILSLFDTTKTPTIAGTVLCTVPARFRPPASILGGVIAATGAGDVICAVHLDPDGTLRIEKTLASAGAAMRGQLVFPI